MQKILHLIFTFFIVQICNSQISSYGISLGINATDMETTTYVEPIFASDAPGLDGFNLGIYADYRLTQKFGVFSLLTYNNLKETYREFEYIGSYSRTKELNNKVGTLQLNPNLKFNTKNEYEKGFYILLGPRISFIMSSDKIDKSFYNSTNYGIKLGFGKTIFNYFSYEFLFDYGFYDTIKSDILKSKTYNFNLNLSFDLMKLKK